VSTRVSGSLITTLYLGPPSCSPPRPASFEWNRNSTDYCWHGVRLRCFSFLFDFFSSFAIHDRAGCVPVLVFWENRKPRQIRSMSGMAFGEWALRCFGLPTRSGGRSWRWRNGYVQHTHGMSSIKTLALLRYMSSFVSKFFFSFSPVHIQLKVVSSV